MDFSRQHNSLTKNKKHNMKTRNIGFMLIAVIMLLQAHGIVAQKMDKLLDSWTLLGTRTVDYTIDRDVIALSASKASITGLKFIVKDGTLNMRKATVHFANGDMQDMTFDNQVNASNDGRVWDLKGNSRAIEKVTFWYDSKNEQKSKSVVEVWGK
jgi:hypothetical protein